MTMHNPSHPGAFIHDVHLEPHRVGGRGAARTMALPLQLRLLSVCIGALFASAATGVDGRELFPQGLPPRHYVTNCDDHGPGSLRDVLAIAVSGDSVDLSQLTCSTITLTTGQLVTYLRDIAINGATTISAGGASRVLSHLGDGTLEVTGLVFADGMVVEDGTAAGGCIYSRGSVFAIGLTVRNCAVSSTPGLWDWALGGGIFSSGDMNLIDTTIVDNAVIPTNADDFARGGGIYTGGNLTLSHSTVSGNAVTENAPNSVSTDAAGGFYARAGVYITYSTVSGNSAHFAGGGRFGYSGSFGNESDSTIKNSTISGNSAHFAAGGLVSQDALLKVWNSTIAFNSADASQLEGAFPTCGGIFAFGSNEYLSFRSSIVANNTVGRAESDVCANYIAPIVGYGNLIVTANRPLPADTIRSDPKLAPLANNGGPTLTHRLLSGSPAIDAGNNSAYLQYDQRGVGRVVGAQADIGAFEVQPDVIFVDGFDSNKGPGGS